MRIDQYLFSNGLAPSREKAKALIMAGIVYIDDVKAEKAGVIVPDNANVEVRGNTLKYVSRGGLKLEKALHVFDVNPSGKICMDIGASTGGFTDCLLQNGAEKVYSVDVGYGQLAWQLRNDQRVVVLERTNIRLIEPEKVPDKIELFTIDVSFISLKLVLPAIMKIVADSCDGICLIKPQFEAGREKVGKKGVVRDPVTHLEVIFNAMGYAAQNGLSVEGLDYSPIRGPEGNIEFIMHVKSSAKPKVLPDEYVKNIVEKAAETLN